VTLFPGRRRKREEQREQQRAEREKAVEELESWHHDWRLRNDADYREVHRDEWCVRCDRPRAACPWWCQALAGTPYDQQ